MPSTSLPLGSAGPPAFRSVGEAGGTRAVLLLYAPCSVVLRAACKRAAVPVFRCDRFTGRCFPPG